MDERRPRICIFGASLDVENMGCRALAISLVKLIRMAVPDAELFYLYGERTASRKQVRIAEDESVDVQVVNFRLSPRARLQEHLAWIFFLALAYRLLPLAGLRRRIRAANPWLRCLCEADFIGEINGGDSFSDIYGLRRFFIRILPSLIALLLGKELVLLPQTYGPYKSATARILARGILRRARTVFARDRESEGVIRELMGDRARVKVTFCPDVAFCMAPVKPAEARILPPLANRDGAPLVGLNVSGLLYVGGYTGDNMFGLRSHYPDLIDALIGRLLEFKDLHLLLVPHTMGQDLSVCRRLWERTPEPHRQRVHLLDGQYNADELKAVIGQCDFFIGSRMHACIGAISQHVPTVALAYSGKFHGVLESMGLGELALDARAMPASQLIAQCVALYEERTVVAARLQAVMPPNVELLKESFASAVMGGVRNAECGVRSAESYCECSVVSCEKSEVGSGKSEGRSRKP